MSMILSTAPHIRTAKNTPRLMGSVLIALAPCAAAGICYWGLRAALILLVSTASAVLAEYLWQVLTHRTVRIGDCSAAVTGLLLGLTVSPAVPWWSVMIGSVFAIIVVKQLFGGIGDNFLNPALAARAVLLASWPAHLTAHIRTGFTVSLAADAVTAPTPLTSGNATIMELMSGNVPGAIGETCKIAILIGFVFLLLTGTVSWRIPCVTVLTAFVFSWVFNISGGARQALIQLLEGGILFGAVYMATDYATSPMTSAAQMIYAFGIGLITVLIRRFGAYPEGVTYAILLMNIASPLLDRFIPQRVYGHGKKGKEV